MKLRSKRWQEGKGFLFSFVDELRKFVPYVIEDCRKSGQNAAENYELFISQTGIVHKTGWLFVKPAILIELPRMKDNQFSAKYSDLKVSITGLGQDWHLNCKLSELEGLVEKIKELTPEAIQAKIEEGW